MSVIEKFSEFPITSIMGLNCWITQCCRGFNCGSLSLLIILLSETNILFPIEKIELMQSTLLQTTRVAANAVLSGHSTAGLLYGNGQRQILPRSSDHIPSFVTYSITLTFVV